MTKQTQDIEAADQSAEAGVKTEASVPTPEKPKDLNPVNEKIHKIENYLNDAFVEREDPIHGLTLAMLSDTNIFMIGPPGTGKSQQVKEWSKCIEEANYFSRLLSPTTRDDELVGPPDIKSLVDEGISRRNGKNKLQEAHFIFLDEIFKGSSAIINLLLKAMNERAFDDEEGDQPIPALSIVAASNELPDPDSHLEAAYDRLVLKYKIKRVTDPENVAKMMKTHLALRSGKLSQTRPMISLAEIEQAREEVKHIEVSKNAMRTLYKIRTALGAEGIEPSDRTVNICLQIAQAEAYYYGSETVEEEHLAVLAHALWSDPDDIETVQKIVAEYVSPDEPKIINLHSMCKSTYDSVLEITDDPDAQEGQAVDALNKIEEAEAQITKLIKNIKEKGKDSSKGEKLLKDVLSMKKGLIKTISAEVGNFEDDDLFEDLN